MRRHDPDWTDFVYFLRDARGKGPVKIGCSIQPLRRLLWCNAWSPYRLELLAVVSGGRPLERDLHRSLEHLRDHGEWFRWEGEIPFIVRIAAAGGDFRHLVPWSSRQRQSVMGQFPILTSRPNNRKSWCADDLRRYFARHRARGVPCPEVSP